MVLLYANFYSFSKYISRLIIYVYDIHVGNSIISFAVNLTRDLKKRPHLRLLLKFPSYIEIFITPETLIILNEALSTTIYVRITNKHFQILW